MLEGDARTAPHVDTHIHTDAFAPMVALQLEDHSGSNSTFHDTRGPSDRNCRLPHEDEPAERRTQINVEAKHLTTHLTRENKPASNIEATTFDLVPI